MFKTSNSNQSAKAELYVCGLFQAKRSTVTVTAAHNKPNYKIVSGYLFTLTLALDKAAKLSYSNDDRFVKELFKVFFTLLLKLQFVDIVKCV